MSFVFQLEDKTRRVERRANFDAVRGARLSEERVILVYASVELDRSNKAYREKCEVRLYLEN